MLNHFKGNIKPTTEPMLTKTPPLNPQWSKRSVGSDKLSESGQQGLLQWQSSVKTKSIQSVGMSLTKLISDKVPNLVPNVWIETCCPCHSKHCKAFLASASVHGLVAWEDVSAKSNAANSEVATLRQRPS